MRIFYAHTHAARRKAECMIWEETSIHRDTVMEWQMMQISADNDNILHGPMACMSPEDWNGWEIGPNYSMVPTAICAECQGPSFSDYLCIRCREAL